MARLIIGFHWAMIAGDSTIQQLGSGLAMAIVALLRVTDIRQLRRKKQQFAESRRLARSR